MDKEDTGLDHIIETTVARPSAKREKMKVHLKQLLINDKSKIIALQEANRVYGDFLEATKSIDSP